MTNISVTETTPLLIEARQEPNADEVLVITVDGSDDANVQAVVEPHGQSDAGLLAMPVSPISKDPGNDFHALGPMEISPSNRRFILAGIWMGTCLAVSTTRALFELGDFF